ncbi:MAG: hypothetical protein R8J94_21770 [Acidimicrobiia bacterium]|nr:hypothetical protein [Acidimicrobiia bacterium]
MSVRHDDPACGHEWTASPANLYAGWGCPACKERDFVARRAVPKFSRESLSEALNDHGATLADGATFDGNTSHSVALQCLRCGYGSNQRDLWSTPPKHVLNGIGCPCCAGLATTYEDFVRTLEEFGAAIGHDFEKTPSHKPMKGVYCASCGLPCTSAYANIRTGNSTVCLTCQDPEGHRTASYHKWPLAHLVAQPGARSHIAGVYVKRVKPRNTSTDAVSWTKVGYGTEGRSLIGGPRIAIERLFYAPLPAPVAAAIERECHRRCRRYTIEDAEQQGVPSELGITEFVQDPDLALEIVTARGQQWGDTDPDDVQALQGFIDECEGNDDWRSGLDLTAPKPWAQPVS